MKKKLAIAIWVLCFIFFGVLLVNFISNESMIKKYNNNIYEFNKLWYLGFTQPYISSYNKANIYYQKGDYELAISLYDEALTKFPTMSAKCDISVNKAFAMLALIDFTVNTKDDVDPIVDKLLEVEAVLTQYGCANADMESGHDADAQTLFNEVDAYIDYLADIKDTFSFYGNKIFLDSYNNQQKLEGDDFEFSFIEVKDDNGTALDGAEEVISKNDANGLITFDTITYKVSDAGTHYYYVYEIKGNDETILYAENYYYIAIELAVSYNGRTLDLVSISYNADDPNATVIKFKNILNVSSSEGGGGNNNNENDGDGEGNQNNNGGEGEEPNENNQNGEGGENEQEIDPIQQQLQDYMNQANSERNDDLGYDQNGYNYYNGDFW